MSQQTSPVHSPRDGSTTALAERTPSWGDPDWQRFWLTLDGMPWRTLALIPAGEGAPMDFTLSVAVNLSRTGMTHMGGPILVADGTQVPLRQLNGFLADVRACADGGERVIVALAAASSDPTIPTIAKSVDRVVLCVLLGRMMAADAKRTIQAVGASKFLGSVIIHPNSISGANQPQQK